MRPKVRMHVVVRTKKKMEINGEVKAFKYLGVWFDKGM